MIALRTATATQHSDLEVLLDLLSPDLDLIRLEIVIRSFAAFYGALEANISEVISAELSNDLEWPIRKKSSALSVDLALFSPSELPVPPIPVINCDAEVLGALYVMEGATLGGQLIGPHIEKLFPSYPIRIFSVYGDKAPLYWKTFRAVLNRRLHESSELEKAQRTAVSTFELLSQTFEQEFKQ